MTSEFGIAIVSDWPETDNILASVSDIEWAFLLLSSGYSFLIKVTRRLHP